MDEFVWQTATHRAGAVCCAEGCPASRFLWLLCAGRWELNTPLPCLSRPRLEWAVLWCPLCSLLPRAPVQRGIADLPQTSFLLWDRQNCPSYSRSPARFLKGFCLLAVHLAVPSLASPFSSLGFLPPSAFQRLVLPDNNQQLP